MTRIALEAIAYRIAGVRSVALISVVLDTERTGSHMKR
jgi:hypothetical protein